MKQNQRFMYLNKSIYTDNYLQRTYFISFVTLIEYTILSKLLI